MTANYNQEPNILSDLKTNGKERPWRDKKMYTSNLAESYYRITEHEKALAKSMARDKNYAKHTGDNEKLLELDEILFRREKDAEHWDKRYVRTTDCANHLLFKVMEDGSKKLRSAHFCQVRLCAMCGWRRELKVKSHLGQVVEEAREGKYRFLMLTLTCKNVPGEELSSTIDNLFASYERLFRLARVKYSINGWFRALEITHDTKRKITKKMYNERKDYYIRHGLNAGDLNPNFNMYHPHFHVMLAVEPDYFKDPKKYIEHEEWQAMWKQSMRVDYSPMVNIKIVRNIKGKGIKETAKYTVKEVDYIVHEDKPLTDETVRTLDRALHRRRLVAYGGLLRQIHKRLNLDENIDADVNVDSEDETVKNEPKYLQEYKWSVGYKNYVLVETNIDANGW